MREVAGVESEYAGDFKAVLLSEDYIGECGCANRMKMPYKYEPPVNGSRLWSSAKLSSFSEPVMLA